MIQCNTERSLIYQGMHYLDLIASNIKKGGKLLDVSYQTGINGYLTVNITTSYVEGLTKTVEELIYKDDLLITWKLITSYDVYTIFSRKTLDEYLTKLNTRELYVS
ncbi:hypothetical protein [Bacillus thuringiensis]|uniref:hypothetical protein n=1 Tax=Bacillus thuringiensis TaxID=1428 RepID=UPI000BF59B75|nr:hypothetical protein [Bacillus thuringiensis]PFS10853.1 hypothetical protein COK45_31140 [Bacillus thuringiensis]